MLESLYNKNKKTIKSATAYQNGIVAFVDDMALNYMEPSYYDTCGQVAPDQM